MTGHGIHTRLWMAMKSARDLDQSVDLPVDKKVKASSLPSLLEKAISVI